MTDDQKNDFAELMIGLGEVYDKEISKAILAIYWEALRSYELDDIKKAVNNIVSTNKYATFPKPAHFIDFINPADALESRVALAVEDLSDQLCRGDWESFQFKDPVINIVVDRFGGWQQVCRHVRSLSDKDQVFWFKDFERLYRAYLKQPLPQKIPRMVGVIEENNTAKGYLTDETGNPKLPEPQKQIEDRAQK